MLKEAIKIFSEAFKEAKQKYKATIQELHYKKQILRADMDVSALQHFIQKVNENPNLIIELYLKDGSKLVLRSYKERYRNSYEDRIERVE